jgi:signal transduction histidine kinase
VRRQITTLATVIAAVVLAVVGLVLVVSVESRLQDNLDRSLEQRAEQFEAALESDPSVALVSSNSEDRFVQLLDETGAVIGSSPNIAGVPAVAPLPSGRQQASTSSAVPIEDDDYRILVRRFDLPSGTRYVLVGENIDDLRDTLRRLIWTLVIVMPLALGALAAAVWWLVGRTLHPVEEIRRQVAGIGLNELDRRVPTPGSGDEVDRLAETMNDMLERLQSASDRQRRFVADVSHELRTPLTRLRTAIEVNLREPSSDPAETLQMVLGDVDDMQRLIDDLLFLARSDTRRAAPRREPTDLDVLVETEVRAARAALSAEPSDEVVIDMTGVSGAVVEGDASQLARLIRNLLSNAARHAATAVRVSLRETSDGVVLVVADDGPGVAPADRERVFDRFVRLDEARGKPDGGSGLGLAIVRDVANAHGATVVLGESSSGGASVTVSFPPQHP